MSARICLDYRQFQELDSIHPRLKEVLEDVLGIWPAAEMEVTCLLRTPAEDKAIGGSGVHSAGRGADVRTRNLPDPQEMADEVAEAINAMWDYDPDRPGMFKVARSDPHGSGPHLHCQVHPNTIRRLEN